MEKNLQNFSTEDALRLAASPAGQQILALLRQAPEDRLQQARLLAAQGDPQAAARLLAPLLSGLTGDGHGGA